MHTIANHWSRLALIITGIRMISVDTIQLRERRGGRGGREMVDVGYVSFSVNTFGTVLT